MAPESSLLLIQTPEEGSDDSNSWIPAVHTEDLTESPAPGSWTLAQPSTEHFKSEPVGRGISLSPLLPLSLSLTPFSLSLSPFPLPPQLSPHSLFSLFLCLSHFPSFSLLNK